ncbi:hypothetical protein [Corynebacterium variabile]|uniref:hypothetical protein n=1 Tax=Corynebacterium variabile TaxID=1727 RepID=UPI0028A906F3|nr:hypothetical protein [Corynebacterium variabile]
MKARTTARIGVAEADLFPRISFSGFIGFIAGDGAVDTREAKAFTPLHRFGADLPDIKGTSTATRRELFESFPEFFDPGEKLQDAILHR